MIATIAKHFTFDATHYLDRLPPTHKCHRMHGHTYRAELVFSGAVDENGFVLDYATIAELWTPLHNLLDHQVLNLVPGLDVPSTENLAGWICVRFATALRQMAGASRMAVNLERVAVHESSTTWCEVRPHNLTVGESDRFLPGGMPTAALDLPWWKRPSV